MKKRILIALLAILIVVGMAVPAAFATVIGTLNYTVNPSLVGMDEDGYGAFLISIPKPAQAYASVEFTVQMPPDVTIKSLNCLMQGASMSPPREFEFRPGTFAFSCTAMDNRFTEDFNCEVVLEYHGAARTTMTIQKIEQWFKVGQRTDSLVSNRTETVTLVPYSGAASRNADLTGLSISPGTLNPPFDPNITAYSALVPSFVEKVDIYANVESTRKDVEGAGSKNLTVGDNTFAITVTSEDKVATKTYNITVNRAVQGSSGDARLTGLSITPGALKETFTASRLVYSADLGYSVESIVISATPIPGATVSGEGEKELIQGTNTFMVVVTSQDGRLSTSYTINAYRGTTDPNIPGNGNQTGPGDSTNPGGDVGGGGPGGPGGDLGDQTPIWELPDWELPLGSVFPFEDVAEKDWFYGDVYYMWEHSLMNGVSETRFAPAASLTRGMVVTVLYRMQSEPNVSGLQMPFADVAEGAWYYNAIKWAAATGIALGISDDTFQPNSNVTREQLAAFVLRYADFCKTELPEKVEYKGFADQGDIAGYAVDYVTALFKADIIRGKDNNRFDPKGNATRAEFAAMLHRYIETVRS